MQPAETHHQTAKVHLPQSFWPSRGQSRRKTPLPPRGQGRHHRRPQTRLVPHVAASRRDAVPAPHVAASFQDAGNPRTPPTRQPQNPASPSTPLKRPQRPATPSRKPPPKTRRFPRAKRRSSRIQTKTRIQNPQPNPTQPERTPAAPNNRRNRTKNAATKRGLAPIRTIGACPLFVPRAQIRTIRACPPFVSCPPAIS